MQDTLVNVEALAAMLMCGQRSVWRWRDMGRLPAPVQVGRCIRWRHSDISAWIVAGCPDVRRTHWTPPQD